MFDLEKLEKVLIIFLVSALLLGIGIVARGRLRPSEPLKIKQVEIETEPVKEKININEADIDNLMRLEGVGKVIAERIIDYRSQEGRFSSPSDIKNVKGVGPSLFDKIKDDISTE